MSKENIQCSSNMFLFFLDCLIALLYNLRKDIPFLGNSLWYTFSLPHFWQWGRLFIGDGECMHKLYLCCSVWAHLWPAVEVKVWRHALCRTKKARLFLDAVISFGGFNVLVWPVRCNHCGCWRVPDSMSHPVLASSNVFTRRNWCIHQAFCRLVSVGPWSPHEPGWPVDFCHQRPKKGKGQQHSGFPSMCSKNTRAENVTKLLQQGSSYKEASCKSLQFLQTLGT